MPNLSALVEEAKVWAGLAAASVFWRLGFEGLTFAIASSSKSEESGSGTARLAERLDLGGRGFGST